MKKDLRTQHGFTLVELMISMVLGLLIILALITMLINVNRNNSELSSNNRLIENGRIALQLMATDVSHAGYWGGHVPQFDDLTGSTTVAPADVPTTYTSPGGTVVPAVPDPCVWSTMAADADPVVLATYKTNLVGIAVQGTDIPAGMPATPQCTTVITNPQPSTDVLVVRNVEPCLVGSGTEDCSDTRAHASPHLYFQPSRCGTDASRFVLDTAGFNLRAGNCTDAAPIRRFSSSLYYIRDYAATLGDGIPTLVRARFGVNGTTTGGNPPQFLAAQALVEGVESFRVEYGIDNVSDTGAVVDLAALGATPCWWSASVDLSTTPCPATANVLNTPMNRGNGLPDTYVRCTQAAPCTADQLVNATVVKLYVLVRAEKKTPGHVDTKQYCLASSCSLAADYMGPFNDGYKRHLFTQTIRLNNIASRRETP